MTAQRVSDENVGHLLTLDPRMRSTTSGNSLNVVEEDPDEVAFHSYMPSISDNLKVRLYSKDCATQTMATDIAQLKELSQLLSTLFADVSSLKKDLHFAKFSMTAEYDTKLKETAMEICSQANHRFAEIEKMYEERVNVVRRSYKTQLSDAICKLSKEYHRFYGKKNDESEISHKQKLKEFEHQQMQLKQHEQTQREMLEIMRIEMESQYLKEQEKKDPLRHSSAGSVTKYVNEIGELRETLKEAEARVDYLEEMLEEANNANSRIVRDMEQVSSRLNDEISKSGQRELEITQLLEKLEKEREEAKIQLAALKEKLIRDFEARISKTKREMQEQAQKELHEAMQEESAKLEKVKIEEERRIAELLNKQQEMTKPRSAPSVHDTDVSRLLDIQKRQRDEIARLQKELDRTVRTWELKVAILQQNFLALKNEMFLRSSLQRQPAKIQLAALTYASEGPAGVPVGIMPIRSPPLRRHQLPRIVRAPSPTFPPDAEPASPSFALAPDGSCAEKEPICAASSIA